LFRLFFRDALRYKETLNTSIAGYKRKRFGKDKKLKKTRRRRRREKQRKKEELEEKQ
jgi:hypothetical protein